MIIRSFIILILMTVLASCSQYYATRPDVDSRIDQWMSQNEYGKIFSTIDNVNKDHPQYKQLQKLLPSLKAAARNYEQEVSEQALKQAQSHHWQKALDIYDAGIKKYPQSTLLRNERQRYLNDRDEYLAYLERKFLYDQGEWLLKALPMQQEIVRTNPKDKSPHQYLEELQKLARETEKKLGRYGLDAMDDEKFLIADRYISLANTLHPKAEYRIALAHIQQRIMDLDAEKNKTEKATEKTKAKRKEANARKQKARNQHLERFFEYFEEAYQRQEWMEAKEYLEEIKRIAPASASSRTRDAELRLREQIDAYIQAQIKSGEHQYSQGEFERALKTWEDALPLAPDNEDLNKHIARAKRVIENLEKLGGRSPAVRFPIGSEPKSETPP
jgi:tetratricopeptide (TPR) repeat protein